MKIKIINACCDLGVHVDGARNGPLELNKIIKNIEYINIYGNHNNKDKISKIKNLNEVNIFNEKLYNELYNTKKQNKFPITIGGDHSISIGSSLGSIKYENNLGIIWIDSHADFNTFETTNTGNIHGLPFSTITNNNKDKLTIFHDGNYYQNNNSVLIGARDVEEKEQINLKKANIKTYTTNDIHNNSIKSIVNDAIKIASNNTNGIHVSLDIDILDPLIAPGVSIPAKDGITLEELDQIIDEFLKYKDKIKSIDLVEYNPSKDINNITKNITINILKKIITSLM